MPTVKIQGYAYGVQRAVDLTVVWYIYNGNFTSYSCTSSGGWTPTISLAQNSSGKVVIHLSGGHYYTKMTVSVESGLGMMSLGQTHMSGWSWSDAACPTANKVTVEYNSTIPNLALTGVAKFNNNVWHTDTAGKERIYFEQTGTTYFRTAASFQFRNSGNTGIARLNSDGLLNLYTTSDQGAPSDAALAVAGTKVIGTNRYMFFDNELHGSGKKIFTTSDSYLRINQSNEHGSGIWIGSSHLLGGSGQLCLGSNGGTSTSRIRLIGGTYNGTNVITLNGTDGSILTTGVGTIGSRLTITADGGSGYVGGALKIRTHNDYRGAGVFLHNTADNDTWYAGTPYTNHDGEYIIAFQPSVNQSDPEQTAQGGYAVWRVNTDGRSTQRGSHSEARTHLKYEYSGENNYNNADLLTWASEPGISYYGVGIGANIHPQGQYYGRADNTQSYGVYMRMNSANGYVEFWNTTGSSGTSSGQGTKRVTIQEDGDIVVQGGYFVGNALRIAHNNGQLEGHYGAVWDQTTQGTSRGTLHLDPNTTTDHAGGAVTFGASDSSNGTNAHAGIYVRSDGNYGTRMYLSTTDSYASGSKTAITINESGAVTINRSSLSAAGNITAYSDIRLKDRIEQIPDALNKILSIRGVTYERTDKKVNKRQMGVIAQELEAAGLHEVVDDSGEYKSVAYGNLFGLAVEAIRELKQENDELKGMLKSIMEKLNGD